MIGHKIYQGAVSEDALMAEPGGDGKFYFDGVLYLRAHALNLTVFKILEMLDDSQDPCVQTIRYSYNVSIVGHGNVFRYCSPHDDDTEPHHRYHHRHEYDPFGSAPQRYTVAWPHHPDWPLLGEVIDEADRWYWDNRDALDALAGA